MEQIRDLAGDPQARATLDRYLAESLTGIAIVMGEGEAAEECWRKTSKQAADPNARAVRVPDPARLLLPAELRAWKPSTSVLVTFLTLDDPRQVSSSLSPPEALDSLELALAFADALAGRRRGRSMHGEATA